MEWGRDVVFRWIYWGWGFGFRFEDRFRELDDREKVGDMDFGLVLSHLFMLVCAIRESHKIFRWEKRKCESFLIYEPSIFFCRMFLSVMASAANLEMPSRSFSTAIVSSLKSKRNSDSSLIYDFLGMSRVVASLAFSFRGTLSFEL